MSKLLFFITLLATLSQIHYAHAHYVWLERDGNGPARAYLGEWANDIHEKSGGMLDRIKAPRVSLGGGDQALAIKRNENNLEIAVKGRGDLRLVENSMAPRQDKDKGGATKTIYYAKDGRSETAAKLDLELVPTKANGNTFVLLFLGAPVPKAEVTVFGPPKWEKHLSTDDQGRVTVPMPWAGRYVLEVIHFDDQPGGGDEEKFNRTRHISSLSFVQQDGIRWTDKR
ncbi:MAG: DUF4198 domain-containing protein [Candidatus Binatia bacterium]